MTAGTSYFNSLNYSMANEDVALELALCQASQPRKILSICGSGARFLPLAATRPELITALDLAPQQLALAELRRALMVKETWDDYLRFFGYPPYQTHQNKEKRRQMLQSLPLKPNTRAYFETLLAAIEWEGLLYQGKWEQTFVRIPRTLRRFVGSTYDRIFDFYEQKDQDTFFAKKLQSRLWKFLPSAVLLLIGNATFFNTALYRGNFVRKNIPGSYFNFYAGAFRRLFANGLTRENFFLQICFLGELRFVEGNPIEVKPSVFSSAQAALRQSTSIEFVQTDILSYARQTQNKYDFVSLSNVASYLDGDDEQNYLQILALCLNPGALVIVRCYLRIPERTDIQGFIDISADYQTATDQEKMQVYRVFVYKYAGT